MPYELDRAALDHFGRLIEPLAALGDASALEELLERLGWDADALGLGPTALAQAATAIDAALTTLQTLSEDDELDLADLAGALAELIAAARALTAAVSALGAAPGVSSTALTALGEDLSGFLLDQYLAANWPKLSLVMELLGILERQAAPVLRRADGRELRRPAERRVVRLAELGNAMRDPLAYLRTRFLRDAQGGRRAATAVADLLGPLLVDALIDAGAAASYGSAPADGRPALTPGQAAALARLLVADIVVAPEGAAARLRVVLGLRDLTAPAGELGLLLGVGGNLAVTQESALGEVTLRVDTPAAPVLISSRGIELATGGTSPLQAELRLQSNAASVPALRFGDPQGLHLAIGGLSARLALDAGPPADLSVQLTLRDIAFGLGAQGRDAFFSELMPAPTASAAGGELSLGVSLRNGVAFGGRAELAHTWHSVLSTPVLSVGPVLAGLRVDQAGLALRMEATLDTHLGPLSITVQDIGMLAEFGGSTPQAAGGGPLPMLRLSGPKGLSIAFGAGPVRGGGYLFFDAEQRSYAGAVQLSLKMLSFNAVGVVTTRMPDGADGFSMLILITAEFPPIQLGFGFSLLGIGGLAGIHRGMAPDVLADRLREGRLGSILFPRDVVANVRSIVDDIRTVFPPQRDRHVVGPMVKIGWGTGGLLEIDVAVVLSLPSPLLIAILGRMRAALPTRDEAVVDLKLEVLGLIDLGRGRLTVEARLVDSRIAAFAVSGGMALLLSWGATKAFVLSVGGFNRRFLPPADFRAPPRMSIALSSGDNPTFTMSSYFALTPNAVQFGAAVDLYAHASTVIGDLSLAAYASFDVLLIFDPPFFAADLVAGIEVKRNGATLFLARLEASLTGPEPWRAQGYVEFQIVVPIRIPFDVTIGQARPPAALAAMTRAALTDKLVEEVGRPSNWSALPRPGAEAVASLRKIEGGDDRVLVHPLGALTFRQRLLPLEKVIRSFGPARLDEPLRLRIAGFRIDQQEVGFDTLHEEFAPGEFEPLSDDEKLLRPAFETLPAGADGVPAGVTIPSGVAAPVVANYEETVIPATGARRSRKSTRAGMGFVRPDTRMFGAGAAQVGAVAVLPEAYVIAASDTLAAYSADIDSHAALSDRLRRERGAAERAIVPLHEAVLVAEP